MGKRRDGFFSDPRETVNRSNAGASNATTNKCPRWIVDEFERSKNGAPPVATPEDDVVSCGSEEDTPLFGARRRRSLMRRAANPLFLLFVVCSLVAINSASGLILTRLLADDVPSEFGIDTIMQGVALGLEELLSVLAIVLCGLWARSALPTRFMFVGELLLLVALGISVSQKSYTGYQVARLLHAFVGGVFQICSIRVLVMIFFENPRRLPFAFGLLHFADTIGVLGGPVLGELAHNKWTKFGREDALAAILGGYSFLMVLFLQITRLPPVPWGRRHSILRSLSYLTGDGRLVVLWLCSFMAWSVFSIWTSVLPWHFQRHHTLDSETVMMLHFGATGFFALGCGICLSFTDCVAYNLTNMLWLVVVGFLGVLSSMGLFHAHLTLEWDYFGAITSGFGMGAFVVAVSTSVCMLCRAVTGTTTACVLQQNAFLVYASLQGLGVLVGRLGGYSSVAVFGYSWGQLYAVVAVLMLLLVCLLILKEHLDSKGSSQVGTENDDVVDGNGGDDGGEGGPSQPTEAEHHTTRHPTNAV